MNCPNCNIEMIPAGDYKRCTKCGKTTCVIQMPIMMRDPKMPATESEPIKKCFKCHKVHLPTDEPNWWYRKKNNELTLYCPECKDSEINLSKLAMHGRCCVDAS